MPKTSPLWILGVVVLGACRLQSNDDVDSQVIARVNNEDVTIHELDAELGQMKAPLGTDHAELTEKVVQRLIDRKLFAQQALQRRLDRTPETMLSIELSRDEALARSYRDQLGNQTGDPTDEEVRRYYDRNPKLFVDRKYFELRQLVIELGPAADESFTARLDAEIGQAATVSGVVDWLETKKLSYQLAYLDEPSEYFSERMRDVLYDMKPGQVSKVEADKVVIVIALVGTRAASLDLKSAAPQIRETIRDSKRTEFVESQLENLRRNAAIVYFGVGSKGSEPEAQR